MIILDTLDCDLAAKVVRKYFNNNQHGFTLIELIVVIVMIGILSSIAVPSFQLASKKARQRGVAAQISTYIRAAQAFYGENSSPIKNVGDLSNYVDVIECRYHLIRRCSESQNSLQRNMGQAFSGSTQWNSTSGMYTITMRSSDNNRFRLNAVPQRQDSLARRLSDEDFGVSGCLNYSTVATQVVVWNQIGHRAVRDLNC